MDVWIIEDFFQITRSSEWRKVVYQWTTLFLSRLVLAIGSCFFYLSVVLSFFFFFCNCFVPILNLICQTYCTRDRELLRSGNDNSKDTDHRNGNGDVEAH